MHCQGNIHIGGKTTTERTYFGRDINRTLRAKNQPVRQKVKIGTRILKTQIVHRHNSVGKIAELM